MADKTPQLLTTEQRLFFTSLPEELTEKELVQYYHLMPDDLIFIKSQHGSHNRLGVALQLGILRHLGRTFADMVTIPEPIVAYVAEQLAVSTTAMTRYGQRVSTVYEHLEKIRRQYGYHNYDWPAILHLTRHLLPLALESDEPFPLVEAALLYMKEQLIIAPGITTTERLIRRVQGIARYRTYRYLTRMLTIEQTTTLDELLDSDKGVSGKTRLSWLRIPPGNPSPNSMYLLVDQLTFLRELQLPSPIADVHPNYLRQLANRCRRYKAQALSNFQNPVKRHAFLVAYLTELSLDLTDHTLDMFDRWLGDLLRKGRNAQKHHLYNNVNEFNRIVNIFATAFLALLEAREQGADPIEAMFQVVDEKTLTAAAKSAKTTMRPADMDYRDLLENRYTRRRKALLQMYRAFSFEAIADGTLHTLQALDHVIILQDKFNKRVLAPSQTIKKQTMIAPLEHLKRTRWKRHTLNNDTINPNYYELCAWHRLKEGLRSGDIAVEDSHRYREFDSYLLSSEAWQTLKAKNETRLVVTDDAQLYLRERQQIIEELLSQLFVTLQKDSFLTLDEAGVLRLSRPEKSVPEGAKAWSKKLYSHFPHVELSDVIIEVAASTGCLDPFIHLTTDQPLVGRQREILIATLMGLGMNLGMSKMAQATAFTDDQLETMADWHIREDTLRQAQIILDNFVLHHPFSKHWGQGTTSSSDGLRLPVPVKAPNALYNARYFGFKRGITIVTHSADIWMPFSTTVANDAREALHVIDALCHHETDFDIREHHTDTGGYTYHVFALCMMLGFRFSPRIRSITKQYLFTVEPTTVEPSLQHLIKGQIDVDLIRRNLDGMCRLAASIRQGTVSASLIMRKMASYPRQNQLARAFNEIGKLERTIHVLTYIQNPKMQQRIRRGLNKGEAIHALEQALRIGQAGEMRERDVDAQRNRASCLMFLISAISAWNTVYLDKVVSALDKQGITVPAEYLPHIAPLGWNHINFLGKYEFDLSQSYSLNRLRPFRKPKITV